MIPVSYLIAVTATQPGLDAVIAVFNIAGRGQAICGFSNGGNNTTLFIIPKGKGNRQEVLAQLQAVPAIRNVSVVAVSNPVQATELTEVRALFTHIGWDASGVSDDTLSVYMNTKLNRQDRFYIDCGPREKAQVRIHIKPLEEHPFFSPDWLNAGEITDEEEPDKVFTVDDFEVRDIVIQEEIEAPPPPPPPPGRRRK